MLEHKMSSLDSFRPFSGDIWKQASAFGYIHFVFVTRENILQLLLVAATMDS